MLNHIVVMGRLTRDPELRHTQNGTAVASFSLAVDRDLRDESGNRVTDFFDCVAWGARGEFVSKYFTKGILAVVSGRMQFRDWQDKEGNKRRSAEINVETVYFGESKSAASAADAAENEPKSTDSARSAKKGAKKPVKKAVPIEDDEDDASDDGREEELPF